MMVMAIQAEPEWCLRIRRLVEALNLTQAALAERLGVSPATVSRWMQGKIEPTAEGYVALGNLAPRSDGVYFLERAGLNVADLADPGERRAVMSLRTRLQDLKVIAGRRGASVRDSDSDAVAVPLLKLEAAATETPRANVNFVDAEVENTVVVPLTWCPHPEQTVAIQLADDSMVPLIPRDAILFVDTAETDRELVRGSIVVMGHRDHGLRAARLQRFGGADLLMSTNNRYSPLDVSNAAKWKVCGRVLWWIARDEEHAS
jgi:transcriptional regulator with XRE-family HTH domain